MNKLVMSILIIIFISGCGRPVETTSPIETAYNDGFEVIVVQNGNVAEAKNFKLAEAEALLSNNPTHTLIVPPESLKNLNKIIENENKEATNGPYPLVQINLTKEKSSETIDLSFHDSKSTFHYCYKTENKKIIPLWSSYKDLNKNEKTIYK